MFLFRFKVVCMHNEIFRRMNKILKIKEMKEKTEIFE